MQTFKTEELYGFIEQHSTFYPNEIRKTIFVMMEFRVIEAGMFDNDGNITHYKFNNDLKIR